MKRHWKGQWLLRLYPPAWRERYADEFAALLGERPASPRDSFDIVLGALDARLHTDAVTGRLVPMIKRLRSSEIGIFCASVLFGVAWLGVWQMRDPLPVWENAVRLHPEIRTAFVAVEVAGLVVFLAVLAGGLPLLLSAIKQAFAARRWSALALWLVPFLAAAALAGYGALASASWTAKQSAAPDAPLTPLAVALQLGLLALVALAIGGSTLAVALAVARGEPSARVLRFALAPAAVVTLAIGLGFVATVILWALTLGEAPELSSPFTMTIVVALMAAGTGVALVALRRGLRARAAPLAAAT